MTNEGAPLTAPIKTGRLSWVNPRKGLSRVRESALPILQIVVATTAAFVFARYVLGHETPLLAATVTVSSLGLVRDARPRRVVETVLGMLVGILIAELVLVTAGAGWWQMAITLGVTLAVARFISAQPSFAIAAGIQAIIVMVIPANAPFLRLADGVVGGVAAVLATALIPRSLVRSEIREARRVFDAVESVMGALSQSLRRGDRRRAERGLEKARGLQKPVDDWHATLDTAIAVARISPFMHAQGHELTRHERIRHHVDFASRNLRVVARRTVYLTADGVARPVAADLLSDIARGTAVLADSLDDISLEPIAREAFRAVAGRLDPTMLLPDASTVDQGLIGALRPLVVDLLMASGMSGPDASACVPRV